MVSRDPVVPLTGPEAEPVAARVRGKGRARVEPPHVPEGRPGQVGGKRDVNRRARTQGLLDAAQKLFLERGLEAVTIDEITREAGVAKGSFYRYFKDKEEVVRALLEPGRERIVAAFERAERKLSESENRNDVKNAYTRLGKELATALLTQPQLARLYLQESRAPGNETRAAVRELEREVARRALSVTQAAFSRGLMRRVHPQVSTLAVIGAAERLLHAFFHGDLTVDPTVAIQDLVNIVLDGVRE